MLKWLLGILLIVNIALPVYMLWGGGMREDASAQQTLPAFNTDKIKLLKTIPPVAVKADAICMQWGEFSGSDLARATEALDVLNLGDRRSSHEVEHASGYWVYISPLKTHAALDKKVAELKSLGIADYYVVQDAGPWQNAISLGVFKTEDAARNQFDKMKNKGVRSAEMGERISSLKFIVFDFKGLDASIAAKITELQKQFEDSELKPVPCAG